MKKLVRSETNKMFLGVCGGIAEYLGVDANAVRVLFALFCAAAGSGLFLYMIIALIMRRPVSE